MNKPKFSKPPETVSEKEKKALDFIENGENKDEKKEKKLFKKGKSRPLFLRATEKLWNDVHEISALTGISINAICLELLRVEVQNKLKSLREENF